MTLVIWFCFIEFDHLTFIDVHPIKHLCATTLLGKSLNIKFSSWTWAFLIIVQVLVNDRYTHTVCWHASIVNLYKTKVQCSVCAVKIHSIYFQCFSVYVCVFFSYKFCWSFCNTFKINLADRTFATRPPHLLHHQLEYDM